MCVDIDYVIFPTFILSSAQNVTPYCNSDAHAYLELTSSIDQTEEEKKRLNSQENVRFLLTERAAKFDSISVRPATPGVKLTINKRISHYAQLAPDASLS